MGVGASDLGGCWFRDEDADAHGAVLEVVACRSLQGYHGPVSVCVPDGATSLEDGAFRDCRTLLAVTLPAGLRSIGDGAFRGCTALRTVSMPNTVSKIGSGAFSGCHSLRSVNIPASVTDIEDETFSDCKALAFVGMPPFLHRVGNWAFFGCASLAHVDLPKSVAHIGRCAFYSCSGIDSVSIPRSVTVLERGTFAFCTSLTDVDVPDTIVSVGAWAFRDCSSLMSLKLPSSVTTIGQQAFAWCSSLRSMDIPPSITSIGPGAFASCVSLGRVEIPESVTHIGDGAFIWCLALTSVEVSPATSMGVDVFFGCGTRCIMGPQGPGQPPFLPDAAVQKRVRGLVGSGYSPTLASERSESLRDVTGLSPGATCTTACSEDDLRTPGAALPQARRRHVVSAPDSGLQLRRDCLRGLSTAEPALQAVRREAFQRELQDGTRSKQQDLMLRRREELRTELRQRQLGRDHAPMASGDESRSPWSFDQRLDYRRQMEIARIEGAGMEEQRLRRARAPESERESMQRELAKQVRSAPETSLTRRWEPALGLARNSHGVLVASPVCFPAPDASRTPPSWSRTSSTGDMLMPGDLFEVSPEPDCRGPGGSPAIYLKLADGRGWVFNRPGVGHWCQRRAGGAAAHSQPGSHAGVHAQLCSRADRSAVVAVTTPLHGARRNHLESLF